jgi:hypothetical protein
MSAGDWALLLVSLAALPVISAVLFHERHRTRMIVVALILAAIGVSIAVVATVHDAANSSAGQVSASAAANPEPGQSHNGAPGNSPRTSRVAAIMQGTWSGYLTFHGVRVKLSMDISSQSDGYLRADVSVSTSSMFMHVMHLSSGTAVMQGHCTATSVTLGFIHWAGSPAGRGLVSVAGTPPTSAAGAFSGYIDFSVIHESFTVYKS